MVKQKVCSKQFFLSSALILLLTLFCEIGMLSPLYADLPYRSHYLLPEGEHYYNFSMIDPAFPEINLKKVGHFSRDQIHSIVLKQVPYHLRSRLNKALPLTLELAERYQLDPFWVLAIMWNEGHFNLKAQSSDGGIGGMQVMPGTIHFLKRTGVANVKKSCELVTAKVPFLPVISCTEQKLENYLVEMGVRYLRYLKNYFRGESRLATVAYNRGPKGLRSSKKILTNPYLQNIERYYKKLIRPFIPHQYGC